jgi:S-DNA-T family DNA segregation ATPase FtsK/SpoIIIE
VAPRILTAKEYRRRVEYVLNTTRPHPEGRKWRCVDMKQTRYLVELVYEIPARYSALDVQKQIDALVATCGADVEIVNYAGRVGIRVYPIELPDMIPFDPGKIKYDHGLFFGVNRRRQMVRFYFEHPHILNAGETGWGKTVLITLILWQLTRRDPSDIEIVLIDLKGTSYLDFRDLPHLLPLATSVEQAYLLTYDTVTLMRERSQLVQETGKFPRFKKRFVIIDEAAELCPKVVRNKHEKPIIEEIDYHLSALARIGRELGIHIIYCTQYPHHEVVNPQIRFNCGARICFHVEKEIYSQVILDEPGAEQLPVPGRAIFKAAGRREVIQVPYASREQWKKWLHDAKGTKGFSAPSSQHHADNGHPSDSEFLPF